MESRNDEHTRQFLAAKPDEVAKPMMPEKTLLRLIVVLVLIAAAAVVIWLSILDYLY